MPSKLFLYGIIGLFVLSWNVLNAQIEVNDTLWFTYPNVNAMNGGEACFYTNDNLSQPNVEIAQKKKNIWKVDGEILYDYMYRSLTNNPLQEKNVDRHMLQVRYKFTGPVPLQGSISYSTSNSLYYPNLFNATLNFNRSELMNDLKNQYVIRLEQELPSATGLTALSDSIANLDNTIRQYQHNIQGADYQFQMQKQKEAIFNEALNRINASIEENSKAKVKNELETLLLDGVPKKKFQFDTSSAAFTILKWAETALKNLKDDRRQLESLVDKRKTLTERFNKTQRIIKDSIQKVGSEFNRIKDLPKNRADALMEKYIDTGRNKLVRILSCFDRISIGRSEVNYSMLTVNTWPITGINISTATRPKFEFAAGFSNFRQRNFLIAERGNGLTPLPTMAFRFHVFSKPTYSLMYTSYAGSMIMNYQNTLNRKKLPVFGNGVQLNIFPLDNHQLEFEFVKSNVNEQRPAMATGIKTKGGLFNFGIRENEGYRMRYTGNFPKNKLKAEGEYSRLGSNFLSLGIYPGEAVRDTYKANVQKQFFHNKLDMKIGVRKNAFTYPYLQQLTSNNVLYQGLLTLKMPKLPVITIGYFPATQLVAMPDSNLAEANFQTLIATASYQISKPSFTHLFLLSGSKLKSGIPGRAGTIAGIYNNFMLFQYSGMHAKWNAESQLVYNNMNNQVLKTVGAGGGIKHGKGWHQSAMIKYHIINSNRAELGYRVTLRSKPFNFGHFLLEGERQMLPFFMEASFVPVMAGHASLILKI